MRRLALAVIGAMIAMAPPSWAAPKAELWERWTASTASKITINHSDWDGFLQRYVRADSDGYNRVAYESVSAADRDALGQYLKRLQAVRISQFERSVQRAYWVNLYNAATVKLVLDHYPISSILKIDISPGLFRRGPWGKKFLQVEEEALSLDDIEHRILRPIWKDARIHYALNCAALGCPNLARRAYTAANTEQMLEDNARAFVNHPRAAVIENGRLKVSSIYVWFQNDFGGDDQSVIAHLRRYAAPPLSEALAKMTAINGHFYDWSLNGTVAGSAAQTGSPDADR